MRFTNQFTVPTDVDTTFATLLDLERVAPCLPGAQLDEIDGSAYSGRVRIRIGPIQVIYRGTAELIQVDPTSRTARIVAQGSETRGTGTARADVAVSLSPSEDGTAVTVTTDLAITGKPAQFGRGVMAEVGSNVIDGFATRLSALLEDGGLGDDADIVGSGGAHADPASSRDDTGRQPEPPVTSVATSAGPRRIEPERSRDDDVLDLLEVAHWAAFKRFAPVALVLVLVGVTALRRRLR